MTSQPLGPPMNPQHLAQQAPQHIPQLRRFLAPEPNESFQEIAVRALPDESGVTAIEKLKSWNLHIFLRRPAGQVLGSDVVFIVPP